MVLHQISRRSLLRVLPAGCFGCAAAVSCGAQATVPAHSASEKCDLTWEELFRFAYQKDLIPMLKGLAAQIGREKFVQMIQDVMGRLAEQGMARSPIPKRDFATFAANLRNVPPMMQHALQYQVLEDGPQALEYRVTGCLWAKSFLGQDAGDIGYAMVCSPDLAVARGFNPKLKLTRTQTLMQGGDSCHFRYTMEA